MLNIPSRGVTRRDLLTVGGLAFASLTLADVLRLRAAAAPGTGRAKAVIRIWLRGGPSHIDSYDMKPDAPAEFRGEFGPIRTNVPGVRLRELMPRQATIMDKFAVVRGIKSNDIGDHTPHYYRDRLPESREAAGLRLRREPPPPPIRRHAAPREFDVRAAAPVRLRGRDLHRPRQPPVRPQSGGVGQPANG